MATRLHFFGDDLFTFSVTICLLVIIHSDLFLHDTSHLFVHDTFTPLFDMKILHPFRHDTFTPYRWNVHTSLAMTCLHLLTMTCSHPWVMIYLHLFGHNMFISLMWQLVCFTSEMTCSHPFGNDPFAPFRWRHVRTRLVIIRRHMKGCFFQKLKKVCEKMHHSVIFEQLIFFSLSSKLTISFCFLYIHLPMHTPPYIKSENHNEELCWLVKSCNW